MPPSGLMSTHSPSTSGSASKGEKEEEVSFSSLGFGTTKKMADESAAHGGQSPPSSPNAHHTPRTNVLSFLCVPLPTSSFSLFCLLSLYLRVSSPLTFLLSALSASWLSNHRYLYCAVLAQYARWKSLDKSEVINVTPLSSLVPASVSERKSTDKLIKPEQWRELRVEERVLCNRLRS